MPNGGRKRSPDARKSYTAPYRREPQTARTYCEATPILGVNHVHYFEPTTGAFRGCNLLPPTLLAQMRAGY